MVRPNVTDVEHKPLAELHLQADVPSEKASQTSAFHNHSGTSTMHGHKRRFSYHLHTIWLLTVNDFISIIAPETAFGVIGALTGPLFTSNASPDLLDIFRRLPQIVFWNWLNCLIFDTANQRLPNSVLEDSVNKKWRPIPSQRLTPNQARRLLLAVIPLVFVVTLYLGGMEETAAMVGLTWMYNDLGGADESYIVRNIINACGFMCYSSGATRVAIGYGEHSLNATFFVWLAIIGAIIFSTLQMQDMADQKGDAARGRGTLPLVHGDGVSRWTIAVPVLGWSFFCAAFWDLPLYQYVIPVVMGGFLALRVLLLRSVEADKVTWKIWCFWTISVGVRTYGLAARSSRLAVEHLG
ncbi:MAG: hypothetical protein MMC33_003236 [Icmadophila ericetorum]|nr:hypothetical protein [Icmadophila ericetorum]